MFLGRADYGLFLCHTYQWISEWRTQAKIVYEIFTANSSPSPNLDKHLLLSNEIIKVFLGTLILFVPVWADGPILAAKPIRYQPEQFQS